MSYLEPYIMSSELEQQLNTNQRVQQLLTNFISITQDIARDLTLQCFKLQQLGKELEQQYNQTINNSIKEYLDANKKETEKPETQAAVDQEQNKEKSQ